jgi:hypothetical protein
LTPHGLAEVTLETAASVRADCVLAPPRRSAMAETARAILRSLRRGFELPPSRHSESAARRQYTRISGSSWFSLALPERDRLGGPR